MENFIEKLKTIDPPTLKKPFSLLEMTYKRVRDKELAQSEMLAGLLSPDENHGHGFELVESFLHFIGVDVKLQKDSNLKIETERRVTAGGIDIFISWRDGDKDHAVIIENKLHNAKDQPDQLNKYYRAIAGEGYAVDKIVYMPLSKEWHESKKIVGIEYDVLEKTTDRDAKDIVNWLESSINDNPKLAYGAANQYKDFLNCLISNQYIMLKAIEIQEKLGPEGIEKLEILAEIARTQEWCIVRFRSIVEQIQKGEFARELKVGYKQNKKYVNYAQFFFDNWKENGFYEVWLYPNDGIYLYMKHDEEYTKKQQFGVFETAELVKYIIPLLQELSKLQ